MELLWAGNNKIRNAFLSIGGGFYMKYEEWWHSSGLKGTRMNWDKKTHFHMMTIDADFLATQYREEGSSPCSPFLIMSQNSRRSRFRSTAFQSISSTWSVLDYVPEQQKISFLINGISVNMMHALVTTLMATDRNSICWCRLWHPSLSATFRNHPPLWGSLDKWWYTTSNIRPTAEAQY